MKKTVEDIVYQYATSSIDGLPAIREAKFKDMIMELEGIKRKESILQKIVYALIRVAVWPFVLVLILVRYLYSAIRVSILFIRFGGEWISYTKYDRKTINEVYRKIENLEH